MRTTVRHTATVGKRRAAPNIRAGVSTTWSRISSAVGKARGTARTEWNEMKLATRDAFERVQNRTAPGMTRASETAARKTDAVWDQAKGNWHQFKGTIKSKWNDLTDDELDQMPGERERIV